MNEHKTRKDDFLKRRKHLEGLSDQALKERFWKLADQATEPLVRLAKTHTSPAIERSVLLRMGFSSLEASSLVEKTLGHDLIGKGAGHVVYRLSTLKKISIRDAGMMLIQDQGWSDVLESFGVTS